MVTLAAAVETGRPPSTTEFPWVFVEWTHSELWDDPGAAGPIARAASTEEWLAGVGARGIGRMLLVIPGLNGPGALPDRHKFGFAGPAGEQLLASGADEVWRVLSEVGDRGAPDRRIWRLLLQGVVAPPGTYPRPPLPTTVAFAQANLLAALRALVTYADRAGLDATEAQTAIGVADGSIDPTPTQGHWLPADWRTPAVRRLIAGAFAANVFRGMGSWNDEAPPSPADAPEHERVSQACSWRCSTPWSPPSTRSRQIVRPAPFQYSSLSSRLYSLPVGWRGSSSR
jgi:hypothetical protein